MSLEDFTTPTIGDNSGDRQAMLEQGIEERHGHLQRRTDELLAAVTRVPDPIPEDVAPKVTDFIKSITAQMKAVNGAREAEKEPHLAASRLVDGIFKRQLEPLKEAKGAIEGRLGKVLRAIEDRKRKEAAEKAERERQEAEARRIEAERIAAEQRAVAEAARREAEAAEQRQREELQRLKEEQLAREAKAKADQEAHERAMADAAAKRQKALEDEEASKRARNKAVKEAEAEAAAAEERAKLAEIERQEEDVRAAKRQKDAERKLANEAEERAVAARKAERVATRSDKDLAAAAQQETRSEARIERVDSAKPADYARQRGDYGALGTLAEHWDFTGLDRDAIDLEALRPHLPEDAMEKAVRSFIRAGGRELRGVTIFLNEKAQVR